MQGVDYDVVVTPQTEAGEYPLEIVYKNNYDGESDHTWTLKRAPMLPITIVKDFDNDSYVYGDEITNDDFPVDGIPDDLKDYDFKYEWIDEDGNSIDGIPDDAGDYKVRVIVDVPDDANYEDQVSDWFDVTIEKADLDDVAVKNEDNDTFVYGDDITNDNFPVDGIPDDLNDYDLKYEWVDADGNELEYVPTDVGDYKVRITVDVPDDGNYNDQTTDWFDVTIEKVDLDEIAVKKYPLNPPA